MTPTHLFIIIVLLLVARVILVKDDKIKIKEETKKNIIENIDSIVIAGVTALLLITFIIRTFYIPSSSMVPTLMVKDYILVNKFVYRFYQPARHDIVVFHPPEAAHAEGKDFIKRVVAVGGDTVEVKNNILYLNDVPQTENYIFEPPAYTFAKVKVPEDSLFVMGDNRNNSDDSHAWGFLPKKNLVGKAVLIFFPFNRFRTM